MNDIAAHLGISISAVEKHMLKAMRHLSAEMEKHRAA
jgi:DNA-directed RNA polymerase specialized sigma24 family protein